MNSFLPDLLHECRRHPLAERDARARRRGLLRPSGPHVNPVATIVKHLAGNLISRWTNFLTTDGEKPTRNRDGEFVLMPDDMRTTNAAVGPRLGCRTQDG